MINMHTKFEVSSLSRSRDILVGLKIYNGSRDVTMPLSGTKFVVHRLGLAMFYPHIKFEMSTITCNEETKGNGKCKNFRIESPFGDLGVTYTVHLWLDGKRVVDFLIAITGFFASSRGSGTIKRNLSKSMTVGSL